MRFHSNESHLSLDAVTPATAGKYSCEVSADSPSFHTLIAAGELEVVETPPNPPFINGIRQRYRIGDVVRGNCSSRHSRPAANLIWTINNEEVHHSHLRYFKTLRDMRNEMETSILGIHFIATEEHFDNGKMKLRCTARIQDVYWKFTERVVTNADFQRQYDEDESSRRSTGSDNDSGVNAVQPDEFYDQYTQYGGEVRHKKDNYFTQLQDFFLHFVPSGKSEHDFTWGQSAAAATTMRTPRAAHLQTAVAVTAPFLLCLLRSQLVEILSSVTKCF